jgi:hypothetical protein
MKPKEKAKELVNKFNLLLPCEGATTLQTLIDCALIAVDEIIQAIRYTEAKSDLGYVGYWQQVKQEINNI